VALTAAVDAAFVVATALVAVAATDPPICVTAPTDRVILSTIDCVRGSIVVDGVVPIRALTWAASSFCIPPASRAPAPCSLAEGARPCVPRPEVLRSRLGKDQLLAPARLPEVKRLVIMLFPDFGVSSAGKQASVNTLPTKAGRPSSSIPLSGG
jgi:hypothetical protein